MKFSLWIIIFITLFSSIVYGNEWTLHTAMNDINAIEYDGDYFWLATTGGVVRWNSNDGSFSAFTAADFGKDIGYHGVLAVAIGRDGEKWFGGDGWIMKYDGYSWSVYGGSGTVNAMAVDNDGTLLIASSAGALRFNDGSFDILNDENFPNTSFSCVAVDDDNTVWFGGRGDRYPGLYKFENESLTRYSQFNSDLPSSSITALGFDLNGLLWIGTSTGICTFNGVTWNTVASGSKAFSGVRDFKFDDAGRVWVGSCFGLLVYDGSDWTTYTEENSGLPSNFIRSVEIDDYGIVWVSTGDQGAIRTPKNGLASFDGTEWKNVEFPGLRGNEVKAVAVDHNDVVWVSTNNENGISFFDGKNWNNVSENEGLFIYDIAVDNDNTVWFGYYNGVSSYDGKLWKSYTDIDGINDNTINAIAVDSDNVKWFGTNNGILSFDGVIWIIHEILEGFKDVRILNIAVDLNNVKWFASYSDGVFSFDGENWLHYTVDDGLVNSSVKAIAVDQNNVKWFGTDPWETADLGISSFDGENWVTYASEDILLPVNLRVNAIVVDSDNVKWFDSGLTFNDSEWKKNYDAIIPSYDVNDAAIDSRGDIWFATERGLLHFDGINDNPTVVDTTTPKNEPFSIIGVYPNPFNTKTTIKILSQHEFNAGIKIYNLLGQTVRNFDKINMMTGVNTVTWDGKNNHGQIVSSGIYFILLEDAKYSVSAGMMFVQ